MSFSLGSLAGGAASGFQSEQQIAMQKALQQQQVAGQTALGNALGGTTAQPPQSPIQGLLAKLGIGAQPSPQPQPQGGAPQPSPMGGGPMPSMGGAPQPQAQPTPPMQPQGQPPQARPQPQGGGLPQGNLTLDEVVSRIKQYNPNISPRDLMAAVHQAVPIMNAQSQAQYRQVLMQLAPKKLEVEQDRTAEMGRHNRQTETQGQERVDQGQARLDQQKEQFATRQAAISARFGATLKEKYDAIKSTTDRTTASQLAVSTRAAIKAQLEATRNEINATFASDPEQAKVLMKQAAADRDAATAQLDAALAAQKAFAAQNSSKAKPVGPNPDGSKNTERATPAAKPAGQPAADSSAPKMLDENTLEMGGKTYRYTGKGDRNARENWVEATGK